MFGDIFVILRNQTFFQSLESTRKSYNTGKTFMWKLHDRSLLTDSTLRLRKKFKILQN